MSGNAVKCPWKKYVLLPDGVEIARGDDCACPSACPNYKSSKVNCRYAVFQAKSSSAPLEKECEAYSYTAQERAVNFPDLKETDAEASEPESFPPREQTQGAFESVPSEEKRTASTQYVFPIFGNRENNVAAQTQAERQETAPVAVPLRRFESFELRGKYYTADGRDRTGDLSDTACANGLFDTILRHFDVKTVFEGTSPRERFLWVLDCTLSGEKRLRADLILNSDNLDVNEKFFALFYGVIFCDRNKPLYWADGFTYNLQPRYSDKSDFFKKISGAKDDGFYGDHVKPVLLWLRRIDFCDWDDGNKVREEIVRIQEDVAKDQSLDAFVFWSEQSVRGRFVCLGQKETFVKNLVSPCKSQSEFEYAAEFLSRYDILRQNGRYRVVSRVTTGERTVSVENSEVNDDVMQALFPEGRELGKLESYLYLLKRHCELFRPCEVSIGPLVFHESLYTEEIEGLVLNACACFFGDAAEETEKKKAYCEALLAKLLYQKAILFAQSARRTRSAEYMNKLLSLVSDDIADESSVVRYFSVYNELGLADKIELYAYDYSEEPRRKKKMILKKWLCDRICAATRIVQLCAVLETSVFSAYRSVFGGNRIGEDEADRLFVAYRHKETQIKL